MAKIESFEQHSDAYDQWFEKNHALYKAELEAIRQFIPLGAEGVEVGVGSGKFAAPLGIKIGVEPSEKMAIKAKELGIEVYLGVAENLPFPDDRFGFVLMVTTICFVDNIKKSFTEAFRVLKPGAAIIIGFVDKESTLGKQYAARSHESKFYKNATFFSAQEVLKYLSLAGFKEPKIKQALIPSEAPETILDGFGQGAFVAIKAIK